MSNLVSKAQVDYINALKRAFYQWWVFEHPNEKSLSLNFTPEFLNRSEHLDVAERIFTQLNSTQEDGKYVAVEFDIRSHPIFEKEKDEAFWFVVMARVKGGEFVDQDLYVTFDKITGTTYLYGEDLDVFKWLRNKALKR